jgi:hypothetical protein
MPTQNFVKSTWHGLVEWAWSLLSCWMRPQYWTWLKRPKTVVFVGLSIMGKIWFFLILLYLIPSFNDIYNLTSYLWRPNPPKYRSFCHINVENNRTTLTLYIATSMGLVFYVPFWSQSMPHLAQCSISYERDGYGNCFVVKDATIAGRPLSSVSWTWLPEDS